MAPTDTLNPEVTDKIQAFIKELKAGEIASPYDVAQKTVLLFRKIVSHSKWTTAWELMNIVKNAGKMIIQAQPTEVTLGNMVRRVLKIIRDEYDSEHGKADGGGRRELLEMMGSEEMLESGDVSGDYSGSVVHIKGDIIEAIGELCTELETNIDNIAVLSLEHIHSDEVILTSGYCPAVENFLKKAASKQREFKVMVAERAPFNDGQKLAKNLALCGIDTTLITDSAVFALMSTVNKVIIGTHAVMANGGLKALSGTHNIALAAKHHSVPMMVCLAMFMVTPEHLCSYDQDNFNKMMSPADVLPYSEADVVSHVQVYNPAYDYVPPDLVTSYITNTGCKTPSYVYRLLRDLYHPDDHDL